MENAKAQKLILASTSKYRKELLERFHTPFEAHKPLADEEALKHDWLKRHPTFKPRELAEALAQAKAESLSDQHPNALIIGSDQLVDLDGEILGKRPDFQSACAQLELLSGRSHQLITAVALAQAGHKTRIFTDVTTVSFRKLSREEIQRYVEIEKPYDCAGTYKIEGLGVRLIQELQTKDPTAIVGLPLIQLSDELRLRGFAL